MHPAITATTDARRKATGARGSFLIASCLLSACAVLAVVGPARASGTDPAQTQFDQGLADMEAERFDAACPKLAESYRLDPQAGVLFTLAECEAKRGKLATAVARYDEFLDLLARMGPAPRAKQHQRERVALAQLQALRPRLAELTVVVAPSAPRDATVERDGTMLDRAAIGRALPIDAGEHKLRLRLPDGRDRAYVITLAEGERRRLELEPAGIRPTAAAPASTSAWPWVALVSGGAAIAVGSVTGLIAIGDASTAHAHCTNQLCDSEGKAAADRARSLGWVSTGALGAGLVLAGVGGWFLLSRPTGAPGKRAYLAPRLLGLDFGTSF